LDFFVNASEKVLLPQRFSLHGFLKSKYQKEFLEKAVYSAIGDTTFAAVKKPLIIPATDIEQGEPYVFKSGYTAESKTHDAVRLVDAIVSSCSAPLYFDPHRTEGRLLSDGGLWAKNPALVAVVETLGVFKRIPEEIRVLSLGTGIEKVTYTAEEGKSKNWGLMQEWRSTQLASAFFHFQTRATEHMVTSLIPSNNYLRLDFEHSGLLRIDGLGKPIRGIIVTRVRGVKSEMPIANIKDMLELPILGVIPEDRNIQNALVLKDAIIHTHPKSKASRAYREIAAKIIGNNSYSEEVSFMDRILGR
jgi:hypothetical protein